MIYLLGSRCASDIIDVLHSATSGGDIRQILEALVKIRSANNLLVISCPFEWSCLTDWHLFADRSSSPCQFFLIYLNEHYEWTDSKSTLQLVQPRRLPRGEWGLTEWTDSGVLPRETFFHHMLEIIWQLKESAHYFGGYSDRNQLSDDMGSTNPGRLACCKWLVCMIN